MHILIVSQYFWPETFRITDLAVTLKQRGHQVSVLTGIPNYPEGNYYDTYGVFKNRRQDYQGITIRRVPLIPRRKGSKLRLILNYFSFAISAGLMGPFLYREKVDVIFVFEPSPITVGLPALVLKKIKHAPILFWVQDLWPESLSATGAIHSPRILQWVSALTKFIYQGCDRILVQSLAFIPHITAMGIAKDKIAYFPNSAEDLYQTPADVPLKNQDCSSADKFHIVFAGNIGAAQAVETILQAMVQLKDYPIHWVMVGDGSKKSWLVTQVQQQGLAHLVHFVDKKPIEAMPYYYDWADVLLVTLKRDPIFALTIPSKVQSYLASGKPIIAAIDGEAARIITEADAGFSGPAQEADILAKNILRMYHTEPQIRQAMGAKGRQYFIENFSKERLVAQLEAWMHNLIG